MQPSAIRREKKSLQCVVCVRGVIESLRTIDIMSHDRERVTNVMQVAL